jgi:hypothetical protein
MTREHLHPRDERIKFLAGDRKQARDRFYTKILYIVLNESNDVNIHDRIWVLKLIEKKLQEKK